MGKRLTSALQMLLKSAMHNIFSFEIPDHLVHHKSVDQVKIRSTRGLRTWLRTSNRRTLKKEALNWCKDNCKSHWFISEDKKNLPVRVFLNFYNHDEALLFKLTWL